MRGLRAPRSFCDLRALAIFAMNSVSPRAAFQAVLRGPQRASRSIPLVSVRSGVAEKLMMNSLGDVPDM